MNHTTSAPRARPARRTFGRATRLLSGLLVGPLLLACAPESTTPGRDAGGPRPVVIMISFDGFRWDYPDRGVSPNLAALERRGVRADRLIPSFPTKTFPNHYTLVTGLVPDHHGIVANTMYDPELDRTFSLGDRVEVVSPDWWGGVPIWVTAERHGVKTAPLFWPGAAGPIEGVSPSHAMAWNDSLTHVQRVRWVLDRLDLPPDERPSFLTLYFDETDIVGHRFGPDSEEILDTILQLDADLGLLMAGLEERGLADSVNIVVVSDHGMSPTSRDRIIFIDDYVDLDAAHAVDWNPVLALWPDSDAVIPIYEALREAHPHLEVFLRDSIPERLHYGTNPRTPPILGIADAGWTITTHDHFESHGEVYGRGNHGYDPAAADMQGVFIAAGPAFRKGLRVPAFPNVDVYPLLMKVLNLPPAPNDGDLEAVEVLRAR